MLQGEIQHDDGQHMSQGLKASENQQLQEDRVLPPPQTFVFPKSKDSQKNHNFIDVVPGNFTVIED